MDTALTPQILHEGYLYKKGAFNKSWKRRYFVLYSDRIMNYFSGASYARHRQKAKGQIKLTQIQRVELVSYNATKVDNHFIPDINATKRTLERAQSDGMVISSVQNPEEYDSKLSLNDTTNTANHNEMIISECDRKLGLKCDRKYSFALISNGRNWILSAENITELKLWIPKLSKLTQGQQIYEGTLNKKHFVLYQNKVLHSCRKTRILSDIDLNNAVYIKLCTNNGIEIGLSRHKNIIFTATNETNAQEWYHIIRSLFSHNSYGIKYESLVGNMHIVHSNKHLQNVHMTMWEYYIIIFAEEQQYNVMKNITFFDRNTFRNYARNAKQNILIPWNESSKIRKASKSHGQYSFCVSNTNGERKFYFSVQSKHILQEWIRCLSLRIKNSNNKRRLSIKSSASIGSISDISYQSSVIETILPLVHQNEESKVTPALTAKRVRMPTRAPFANLKMESFSLYSTEIY